MDALLRPVVLKGVDGPSNGQQFGAELAYGLPAFADRLTLTPSLAVALSSTSSTYRLLWSGCPMPNRTRPNPGNSPWRGSATSTSPPLPQRIIPSSYASPSSSEKNGTGPEGSFPGVPMERVP